MEEPWRVKETVKERVNVHLVRTILAAQKAVDKSLLKTFKIFDENLAAVILKQTKIYWNKPTIVGACVLELAITCTTSTTKS